MIIVNLIISLGNENIEHKKHLVKYTVQKSLKDDLEFRGSKIPLFGKGRIRHNK